MKLHMLIACAMSAALLPWASSAHAGVIAAVDFGLAGSSALETDASPNGGTFAEWALSSANTAVATQTFDGVTVTFPSTRGRNRGGPANTGSFTYSNLLRDLFTNLNTTSTGTTFSVSGLTPDTPYEVRIWSQDNGYNNGATYNWYDTTAGTSALIGSITNVQPASSSSLPNNLAFSIAATVTSDASGQLTFGQTDDKGLGTINGLEISTVNVPEPASLGLLALGGLALLKRRR